VWYSSKSDTLSTFGKQEERAMFLAIKEMRYSKLRYGLIVGIMFLIAYVVFILSGLATGLNWDFKKAIVDWDSSAIVLSEDANDTFAASQLTRGDLDRVAGTQKAPIGLYSSFITVNDEQVNVTVFGTQDDAFLLPEVLEGKLFSKENEITISENLAEEGIKVGDQVKIGRSDETFKVVGITPETSYTVSPVIYTSLDTWTKMKFANQPFASDKEQPINIIVTKSSDPKVDNQEGTQLKVLATEDFIEKLPGFSAQNLTLNAMIYFLFVVATAIVGIFMYVITLQKTAIFGVMKAQGISSSYIARSVIAQTFFLAVVGVGIGLLATIGSGLILPEAVPFQSNALFFAAVSIMMVVVAIIGAFFSVRTIVKIDPLKAIS